MTELLTKEGICLGLKKKDAETLSVKTLLGAGLLMKDGKVSAEEWRRRVTSKGGTTEAAMKVFASSQYKTLFKKAIRNAMNQAKKLSK